MLIAVLLAIAVSSVLETIEDKSIKPILDLSAEIRRAYGCARVTIREAGTKDAPRLSIVYVVGDRPTLPDPQKEMKAMSDFVFLTYTATPFVGVDLERRVPRAGDDETFDSTTQSFEKKPKRKPH